MEVDRYLEDFADNIFGGYKGRYMDLATRYLNLLYVSNRSDLYVNEVEKLKDEGFQVLRNGHGHHMVTEEEE